MKLIDILKTNADSAKNYIENTIADRIKQKQDKLTFDTTPTANSTNPVTSGGIKTAIDSISVPEFTQAEIDDCIAATGLTLNNADTTTY